MKIIIEGTEKEIADFVLAVQNQQKSVSADELKNQLSEAIHDILSKV